MKIYVSGRIKDYENYLMHFERECDRLQAAGHETVNPCELGNPNMTYEEFMKCDIIAMLECDAVYLLDGWETSNGAKIEFMTAAACGLKVYYENVGIPLEV